MNAVMRSQAILVAAQAGRLALSLAIASLLGRHLAPADFGFVALVTSIFVVALEFLDMGTTAAATRMITARPSEERGTLAALLALRRLAASVAVAAIVLLAASGYVGEANERSVLAIAALGVFALHLHSYQLVFQLRQAYGRLTGLVLAMQLAFLLACAAALALGASGAAIALLVVVREVVQAIGVRWMAARLLGGPLHARWREPGMKPLFHAAWMIGVGGLCYKLMGQAGGFLLWQLAAPEALASFNAAQRLFAPLCDAAWIFVTPLIAAMGGSVAHDAARFRGQLRGYLKFLLAMSTLGAIAAYALAPHVLRLLYGEVYSSGPWSAIGAFHGFAFACLFAMVTPVLVVGEMVRGHARALLLTAGACLVVNLAANAWVIPRHGAQGASWVLAASEALMFLVLFTRSAARGDLRPAG